MRVHRQLVDQQRQRLLRWPAVRPRHLGERWRPRLRLASRPCHPRPADRGRRERRRFPRHPAMGLRLRRLIARTTDVRALHSPDRHVLIGSPARELSKSKPRSAMRIGASTRLMTARRCPARAGRDTPEPTPGCTVRQCAVVPTSTPCHSAREPPPGASGEGAPLPQSRSPRKGGADRLSGTCPPAPARRQRCRGIFRVNVHARASRPASPPGPREWCASHLVSCRIAAASPRDRPAAPRRSPGEYVTLLTSAIRKR